MYDSLYHPCKICGGELPNDISSHAVLAECVKSLTETLYKTREWCQEINMEFNRLKSSTHKELTKVINLERDVKNHTEDISTVYDNLNSFGGMLKAAGVWKEEEAKPEVLVVSEKDVDWKVQVMNFLAEFGASNNPAAPEWSRDASALFGYLSDAGWKGDVEANREF